MPTARRTAHRLPNIARCVAMLWCYCAWLIFASASHGADSLIVVTSQSKPHTAASKASAAALKDAGISSRIVSPDEANQEIISGVEIHSVVAIGPKAASSVMSDLPEEVMLTYCLVPDPKQIGLATRANCSGTSAYVWVEDQSRVVSEVLPDVSRVGVLYRSGSDLSTQFLQSINAECPKEWTIIEVDLDEYDSVSDGVRALVEQDLDLVWTIPDPEVYNASTVRSLLLDSLNSNTPVLGFSIPITRAGALVGTSIDPEHEGRRAGQFAADKTAGIHDAPTPIYAVNQIVAKKIGLNLQSTAIANATHVFE